MSVTIPTQARMAPTFVSSSERNGQEDVYEVNEGPTVYSTPALRGKSGMPSDIREGDEVNEAALKDLIRAAVAPNLKSKGTSAAAN